MVNTGSTDTSAFVNQASSAAEQGIGLTVFGIGIDLNQELVLAITKLRGGNYAYLSDAARISSVFDQDFDFLVTPLAYDLRFTLTPVSGFRVNAVYGFPAWATGMSQVDIKVATVFLSRGHGAIVARLEPIADWPSGPAPLSKLELSYQPADSAESQSETRETLYAGNEPLGDTSQLYEQMGVRRTVAYVNAALGMKQACSLYWENRHLEAIALLDRTEALLTNEAEATEDSGLTTEAQRVSHLRSNMQNPAYEDSYYDEGNDVTGPLACQLEVGQMAAPRGQSSLLLAVLSFGLARLRRRPSPGSGEKTGG